MDSKAIIQGAKEGMKKAVEHLENELQKVRAGKANPAMLENVKFDYYGTLTPVNQGATVTTGDARTIVVQPFEKKHIVLIERAIMEANLGTSQQNDGVVIRVSVPVPTEERRKQLVKQAKQMGEEAKVAVRNIRKEKNEQLKGLKKEGISEDIIKSGETEIQKLTDSHIGMIDSHLTKKEAEIMTV